MLVEKKLNAFCVTWSASYEGNKLVNTCSIDNIITLISLYSESIFFTLDYLHVATEGKLAELFSLIRQRKFDELRFWIAKELNNDLIWNIRFLRIEIRFFYFNAAHESK